MLEHLKRFVNDTIELYPQHKEEIMDLYQLCLDEIEEGGSEIHECNLCMNDIQEIIG